MDSEYEIVVGICFYSLGAPCKFLGSVYVVNYFREWIPWVNSLGKVALLLTVFVGFLPLLTQVLAVQTAEHLVPHPIFIHARGAKRPA